MHRKSLFKIPTDTIYECSCSHPKRAAAVRSNKKMFQCHCYYNYDKHNENVYCK